MLDAARAEGLAEGLAAGKAEVATRLRELGATAEIIAEATGTSTGESGEA